MIRNPQPGRIVQVWYAEPKRAGMPHHAKIGMITVVSLAGAKPRNHGVTFDGRAHIAIPAGNLRNPPTTGDALQFCAGLGTRGINFDAHWIAGDGTTGRMGVILEAEQC